MDRVDEADLVRIRDGLLVTSAGLILNSLTYGSSSEIVQNIGKMMASSGFLITAWAAGANRSVNGRIILAGLCFGWFGDLFLIFDGTVYFLAGVASFLLGHLFYAWAFIHGGVQSKRAAISFAILIVPGALICWRVWPGVPAPLRVPVAIYDITFTSVLALAFGLLDKPGGRIVFAGALAFYLSDICVAWNRFVGDNAATALLALPIYFLGQTLIALSIRFADAPSRNEIGVRLEGADPLREQL